MTIYRNERSLSRESAKMPLLFSRQMKGTAFKANMVDCSQDGLCFSSGFPYLPETKLYIKLGKFDDPMPVDVRWSKPVSPIKRDVPYKIGVRFIDSA